MIIQSEITAPFTLEWMIWVWVRPFHVVRNGGKAFIFKIVAGISVPVFDKENFNKLSESKTMWVWLNSRKYGMGKWFHVYFLGHPVEWMVIYLESCLVVINLKFLSYNPSAHICSTKLHNSLNLCFRTCSEFRLSNNFFSSYYFPARKKVVMVRIWIWVKSWQTNWRGNTIQLFWQFYVLPFILVYKCVIDCVKWNAPRKYCAQCVLKYAWNSNGLVAST